jgi:hypothetical protein
LGPLPFRSPPAAVDYTPNAPFRHSPATTIGLIDR